MFSVGNVVAQLMLYATLIIVTMAILDWRESRRARTGRERLDTRRPERSLERLSNHEKRAA